MKNIGFAISVVVAGACASSVCAQSMESLWTNNCAKCHGANGEGGGAGTRTLLTDELRGQDKDRPFFDAIRDGVPNAGMPAFSETLKGPQIWGLVNYLRELQNSAYRKSGGKPKEVKGIFTSKYHVYRIEKVIESGLDTPWAVDFLPSGEMITTERPGMVRVFVRGTDGKPDVLSAAVMGTPEVRNRGQGGLMDVAVHPDYAKAGNGWIYLAFSDGIEDGARNLGMTKIVRGRLKAVKATPGSADSYEWVDEQTIFMARKEDYLPSDHHFGSRIVFTPPVGGKRHMYFSIGERGYAQLAQDLTKPNGKIYRLYDDGTLPPDNPFIGGKPGTYESIFSFGHRNPQGLVLGTDGTIWDTEHAPRGGDELNIVKPGANYGWPLVSFGIDYSGAAFKEPWPKADDPKQKDIEMPVYRWMPSIGACGLDIGKGGVFSHWTGDLFAGGLSGANVDRIRVKDGKLVEREELLYGKGRVRDVVTGPDGSIYVVLNGPDKVIRLSPSK